MCLARGGAVLHSPKYHLLAADLRSDPVNTLQDPLTKPREGSGEPILSPQCPTLLLCECVLAYMAIEVSSRLLRWFVNYFSANDDGEAAQANGPLGCIIYEMFGLDDPFGRVMLNNLRVSICTTNDVDPGGLSSLRPATLLCLEQSHWRHWIHWWRVSLVLASMEVAR